MTVQDSRCAPGELGRGSPAAEPAALAAPLDLTDLSRRRNAPGRRAGLRRIRWLLRGLVPAALLIAWQWSTSAGLVPPTTLASPKSVLEAARDLIADGELQTALRVSAGRALTGLVIGAGIGVAAGLVAGLWKLGEELVDSTLQMLRTVPFIALIPLFVVWFGIGDTPKIVLIAVACIFPVYLNTFAGVRGVDRRLIEVGRVFGLSRTRMITRLVLPNALPSVLVGIRYAMGISLLALVAAEQINASSGLGALVMNASNQIRTDIVIVGVVVYALLGLLVDLIVRLLERLLLPWRPTIVKS
ncbi:ABC transporter permease [Candidatus Frankia alpina]|uniref:ABC transporter permease n=1 Tax=Candidatus Frankia alpina TaxID=2699483 RepID=UPI0013D8815A|nr:ABC transporter permease [Candidatus Frankia alpina]